MGLIITILPVVTKVLPISPRFTPYNFFIAMQVQHSYNSSTNGCILLTHVPTLSVTKEHKSYFGKNRTHDFRTSRCAAYLLDHSGDDYTHIYIYIVSSTTVYAYIYEHSSTGTNDGVTKCLSYMRVSKIIIGITEARIWTSHLPTAFVRSGPQENGVPKRGSYHSTPATSVRGSHGQTTRRAPPQAADGRKTSQGGRSRQGTPGAELDGLSQG